MTQQPYNHNDLLSSLEGSWWEASGFIYNTETFTWTLKYNKNQCIFYSNRIDMLSIVNWDDYKHYNSQHPTISEFYTALNICNLYEQFNNSNKG